MSGTLNSVYNNVTFAIARQTETLTRLQEQASTGSRVNRPSDDPSTAYRVLTLDTENKSLENYLGTIADMSNTLETGSSVIQQMASVIGQTRNSVTQIASGLYDQQSRDRMAASINDSLEQLIQLANTKYNGQYIFGGSDTGSPPYAVERTDGEITAVIYQGGTESRNVNVAPGVSASAYYVGDEIFSSNQRSTPVFDATTGAAAGTGTSSVTGNVWLTVTNDGSNYKISIDDGATFTTVPAGGGANQAVTDSRTGNVLYVDTTGINSTGVELVRIPGTHDAFNALINVRDLLKNDRNLSDSQIQRLRSSSTDSLEEVQNSLIQKEVLMGSKIGFLSNLKSSIEGVKANNEGEASQLQQVDIAQVAIDLSRQQALYQMSLSVAGRMMSLSLLDFIAT